MWRSEHFRRLTAYALSNHAQALAHSEPDSREASRISSSLPHPTSRQCTWGNGQSAAVRYRPNALRGIFYRAKSGTLRRRRRCSWPHSTPNPCMSPKLTPGRLLRSALIFMTCHIPAKLPPESTQTSAAAAPVPCQPRTHFLSLL